MAIVVIRKTRCGWTTVGVHLLWVVALLSRPARAFLQLTVSPSVRGANAGVEKRYSALETRQTSTTCRQGTASTHTTDPSHDPVPAGNKDADGDDDDDDDNDKSEEKESLKSLLSELNDTFEYEGRMIGSPNEGYRCGFVVVLGAPNMGKSTLMNALLQEDLCIATARPQTTRHAILGILSSTDCQVCLVDTPGVIEDPAYKLQEGMMEAVLSAFYDADVLLVVTDLFSTPIPDDELFRKVQQSQKPVLVVVNKIDLAEKVNQDSGTNQDKTVTVEQAVAVWRQLVPNALAILPVSASNGLQDAGVQALRKILVGGPDIPSAIRDLGRPVPGMFQSGTQFLTDQEAGALLPLSPPLYDPELLTDRTDRFIASELIRSSLFETLKKELPYCCEVRINAFKEPTEDQPLIRIKADILVERDSQKVIVIGKGGEQIKRVGVAARTKLEEFFQTKIFLELNVRVDKDWRKKETKLQEFGYLKKKKKNKA